MLRRLSFVTREAQDGMSVSSHVRCEMHITRNARSGDSATSRHESCGLTSLLRKILRGWVSRSYGRRQLEWRVVYAEGEGRGSSKDFAAVAP